MLEWFELKKKCPPKRGVYLVLRSYNRYVTSRFWNGDIFLSQNDVLWWAFFPPPPEGYSYPEDAIRSGDE